MNDGLREHTQQLLRRDSSDRRLDWYERQLVETKEHDDIELEGLETTPQPPTHIDMPADFRGDGYACWVREQALGDAQDEEASYHVAKLAVVTPVRHGCLFIGR